MAVAAGLFVRGGLAAHFAASGESSAGSEERCQPECRDEHDHSNRRDILNKHVVPPRTFRCAFAVSRMNGEIQLAGLTEPRPEESGGRNLRREGERRWHQPLEAYAPPSGEKCACSERCGECHEEARGG